MHVRAFFFTSRIVSDLLLTTVACQTVTILCSLLLSIVDFHCMWCEDRFVNQVVECVET